MVVNAQRFGEIKFACVLTPFWEQQKGEGAKEREIWRHDHDGGVHANAHAVAGEERADGGRAGL